MIISRYLIYFIIFSLIGWIWESIYCTIINKEWRNRGFLFGPICPIYGFGCIFGVGLTELSAYLGFTDYSWWYVVIVFFVLGTALEYFTSWLLEKLFHAYWWDYSDMPLNIKGRICLPASLFFGFGGLLIVYVVAPACFHLANLIPPLIMELIALIFMAVLAADTTLTLCALSDFLYKAHSVEDDFNEHMNALYASLNGVYKSAVSRIRGINIKSVRRIFPRHWVRHALKWHHTHNNIEVKSLLKDAESLRKDTELLPKDVEPSPQALEAQPTYMENERQTGCDDIQSVKNRQSGCV